ncbi:hypothetical protein H9L39_10165 [Fusarium oxysporum f. sp. albedinis]|nr:hypothetical protein H9L39_10165 [Fusarium oxysporum f. sp. albedinis]
MIKSRRFAQAAWLGSQVETPWGILGWPVKLGRVDEQHEKIRTVCALCKGGESEDPMGNFPKNAI